MKHGFLIFNPSSGTRPKSKALVARVLRTFASHGIDMTPSPTEPEGSVVKQVQSLLSEKPDLLVSWGGDGTVNEIVNGAFGSEVPLGIISGGTANVLARELGISTNPEKAIQVIADGRIKRISVGQANQRYFVLMAGVGFDSNIIENVNWSLKKKLGKLAFGVAALTTARKYLYPEFHLALNGCEKDAVFAVVCNARGYAAYFTLTPDADISDDYLYVCLFKEAGLGKISRFFLHAFRGKHQHLESVEILRAKEVDITGDPSIAVQADGELIGFLPMKFRIFPQSFNVFCP